ncbi:pyridoxal phosphate-dependent aminotransferase [Corynebacterium sanguinis]|uniref:pyridoxal phosphate-dependent aminotransferase n=1 Tax=Corynebacterium sanguinis TaxID=2594913 RepID=UPI00223AFF8E|nr:pyridoxal phosphate-dependent aminotransferase [Corynebacterium sanguinis]MCT1414294.1 pyridoxal phosphate-dependent aminotransferase [Corynebacterium sanguinis]
MSKKQAHDENSYPANDVVEDVVEEAVTGASASGKPLKKHRHFDEAEKLKNVFYDIRGPVSTTAEEMERDGHTILKLNTGNPALFGFEAPDVIMRDMIAALPTSQGYTTSKGIVPARRAIVTRYEMIEDFPPFDIDDVFLGNGVSELISMVTQALLNDGDEILIPAPDYPLWTAASTLAGGKVVHYLCDEDDGWNPSLEDIRSKVTPRTKAIVVINPNNPTGAVYSRETLEGIADIAREHELMVLADEIYDRVLYDGAQHISMAEVAPDLITVTFNGLSKTYRVCGYRAGWMIITGPRRRATGFIEGLNLLSGTRLCANVPGQHAIQVALGGRQSIYELTGEGGRLREQRDVTVRKLREIPGVSVVEPKGALYCFPKIDTEMYNIHDDERFMLDLLKSEKILMVQGTGFNYPTPDHFRVVTLPWASQLENAIERLGNFLSDYHQH